MSPPIRAPSGLTVRPLVNIEPWSSVFLVITLIGIEHCFPDIRRVASPWSGIERPQTRRAKYNVTPRYPEICRGSVLLALQFRRSPRWPSCVRCALPREPGGHRLVDAVPRVKFDYRQTRD